jgi:hypothetical protein
LKHLPLCFSFIVAVAILFAGASPAVCAERDHEEGFFLRLGVGGGPAGSEIKVGSEKIKLDGTGVDLEVAIGGIIVPNLAVHGTIFGWLITDPDAEIDLSGIPPASGTLDGDFSLNSVGVGLTYYVMPINLYLTGTLGFGQLSLDLGSISGDSDTGFSMEAAVGKEWFVSNRWGIGVAVGIIYHSFSDPGVDENWSGISIPIRFSATFN